MRRFGYRWRDKPFWMHATVRAMKRRVIRGVAWGVAGLAAVVLAFFAAALIGSVVPANRGWTPPAAGIPVFVRTNGVHTWIMVPAVNAEADWRGLAPAAHVRRPDLAGDWVAIGFGNRDFYLNTPTWSDLKLSTALKAAVGIGPGLVHVEHEAMPRVDADHRLLLLRPEQYRRLVAFLRASFVTGPDGRSRPLIGRGYAATDVFYAGAGRYNAFRTCNEWTGAALRHAGVRTGAWTPFEWSVMRWLPEPSAARVPLRQQPQP